MFFNVLMLLYDDKVAEDSRKGMAFVTERIVCSLADLLSRFEQIPGRYNWHTNYLESNATITGQYIVAIDPSK